MGSGSSKTGKRVLSKVKPTKIISTPGLALGQAQGQSQGQAQGQGQRQGQAEAPVAQGTRITAEPPNRETFVPLSNITENETDKKLIMNMNTLMDKKNVPFLIPADQPKMNVNYESLDDLEIKGKAKELYDAKDKELYDAKDPTAYDAKDPTAPTIRKRYVKYNGAIAILENRKKVNDSDSNAVQTLNQSQEVKYRLSTKNLTELLRLTRQDPIQYRHPEAVNAKLLLTHMENHTEETTLLRQFYNVPELLIRENKDGSIDGHWVDDLHEFNKSQSKHA